MFAAIGLVFTASECVGEIISFELHGTASLRTDSIRPIDDGAPFVARLSYERNVPRTQWVPNPGGERQPPPPGYQGPLSAQYWYNGMQFLVGEPDASDLPNSDPNIKHWFDIDISVGGLRIHAGPFEPATIGIANDIPGNGNHLSGGDSISVIFPRPATWPDEFHAEYWHPSIQMYWWDPTGLAFPDASLPVILRPDDFENPYFLIFGTGSACAGDFCPSWSISARIESVIPVPEPSGLILASIAALFGLGGLFIRRKWRS